MKMPLYSSAILVWLVSLFVLDVQAQVGGTPSTIGVVTEAPGASSVETTLAGVTQIPTSTQEDSLVTAAETTIASIVSTTSSAQGGDSGERADVVEEGVEYPDNTTPVPDVTTTTTATPVASSSPALPTTAAASPTVTPLPIPQDSTTSQPEIVQTSASPVPTSAGEVTTQPSTSPAAVGITSPSSIVTQGTNDTTTEKTKTRITGEIISVDNEVETDFNGTILPIVMSTIEPEENDTTDSSSEFELDSNITTTSDDEVPSTSITFTTDDRSAIDSLVQAACEKEQRIDTVVILGVVVIVNVISVVVTALCVYRVVKRHLSWDPPPFAFPKGKHGDEPLDNRSGLNLASDADCKSGEGGTNIPIIITNEDGWCVPYTENDIKKTTNKVEDTGV